MAEMHDNAEKDYMSGLKYQEIADKYGVTINTVKSWKKRYAWERKKGAHKNEKGCTQNNKVQRSKIIQIDDGTKETLQNEDLTPEQQMFCIYYNKTFNATQSYLKVYGCTYESTLCNGPRLLGNARVRAELERLKEIKRQQITMQTEDIVEIQMRIAFSDIGNYVSFGSKEVVEKDDNGNIITDKDGNPFTFSISDVALNESENTDTQLIQEVKKGKDGVSIKLADKQKAMDWLSKYFLMHPDDKYRAEYDRKKAGENNKESLDKLDDVLNQIGGVV